MVKQTDVNELLATIQTSTKAVRGNDVNRGYDTLLFLNTQYESFPVSIQQDIFISSSAIVTYNNLWIWAKTNQASAIPASMFPGYDYIQRATNLSKGTVASCMTQLRLQRYITLAQKVRSEQGFAVGNDYILNDEPMEIPDTLTIDSEYIDFVEKCKTHRHMVVVELADIVSATVDAHVSKSENPFQPSTQIEKINTRQQAAAITQKRLFPDEFESDLEATHFYGIPIDAYNKVANRVHKVNLGENAEFDQVHNVNSVVNPVEIPEINQVHKVNSGETLENTQVHKVKPVVNSVMNHRSSGFINNTTTDKPEFTEKPAALIYPEFNTPNELAICKMHIGKVNPEHQQPILDELSARMSNTSKKPLDNPIGYMVSWLMKTLNDGGIPYTSEGAKVAAQRENSSNLAEEFDHQSKRQQRMNLQTEVKQLERLIAFERKQGKEPVELIDQLNNINAQLAALVSHNQARG